MLMPKNKTIPGKDGLLYSLTEGFAPVPRWETSAHLESVVEYLISLKTKPSSR